MKPKPAIVRILWIAVVFLSLIGVAVVIRRVVALNVPSAMPRNLSDAAALDSGFAQHRLLTALHILPGLIFIVLGPFQFIRTLRSRRRSLHRWMGRVFLISGAIIGTTALVMSPQMAIGGANETAATMFFAAVFLFALLKAFLAIRSGDTVHHREWMIRAYAIGLAVATIRPIVGIFFATRTLTHLTPHEFFGTAFWLGFTAHLIAAQVWIDYTRAQPAPARKIVRDAAAVSSPSR